MHYKDIPKFTRTSNNEVDVPIGSVKRQLELYREAYTLDLNPDFQRGHVWTEGQQIAYIEFILKGGGSGRILYFNCAGYHYGKLSPMVIVDGLQRLTALLRYTNDEIPACGCYFRELTGLPIMTLTIRFNVNDLETRAEVLQWYLDSNGGGTPHAPEELARVKALLDAENSRAD